MNSSTSCPPYGEDRPARRPAELGRAECIRLLGGVIELVLDQSHELGVSACARWACSGLWSGDAGSRNVASIHSGISSAGTKIGESMSSKSEDGGCGLTLSPTSIY